MRYHHKKTNSLCFDKADLEQLYKSAKQERLLEEMQKLGYSLFDLRQDRKKMEEVVDIVVKGKKDKEEIEFFSALFLFPSYYSEDTRICFLLKDGVDPNYDKIDTLEKLRGSLKENDITDFGIMTDGELRNFQLKFYTGATKTDELFDFIKAKLLHYGNDLGDTNFLIALRSKGNLTGNFFQVLHKDLKTLGIKGGGHILVSYNENNQFDVINTVYPDLNSSRTPHTPSQTHRSQKR